MAQPKVKKPIGFYFQAQNVTPPKWLFSKNVVASRTSYDAEKQAIILKACKPHFCDSDSVEGEFSPNGGPFGGEFMGGYTQDGKREVYIGPDN